jgi:hypothetical protein
MLEMLEGGSGTPGGPRLLGYDAQPGAVCPASASATLG